MGKAINTKCKKCGNWYFRRGYCKANGEEISGVDCIHIGGSQAKFCTECGENFAGITHFYENGKEFAKNKSGLCDQIGGKNVYPQDLEAIANHIPGIYPGRTAAFGLYDDRLLKGIFLGLL